MQLSRDGSETPHLMPLTQSSVLPVLSQASGWIPQRLIHSTGIVNCTLNSAIFSLYPPFSHSESRPIVAALTYIKKKGQRPKKDRHTHNKLKAHDIVSLQLEKMTALIAACKPDYV
ncbi:hypothetical protein V9T40_003435 [Parthenolecanium corni]|uniref:Uncharacterized protein n=1 Tax=Parthenolecanium corni TaxID=536013 RepID=A0AAN9TV22_9HEMI